MSEQFADESLAFLYKAAASRGPGKRPVRVVSRERLLANFESLGAASDDEEDDEDFKPEENADDSGSDDVDDVAEESSDEERGDDGEEEESAENSTKKLSPSKNRQDRVEPLSPPPDLKPEQEQESLICSSCLNMRFHDQEVVQCDRCGLCVHEACYGSSDDWGQPVNNDEQQKCQMIAQLPVIQRSISNNETTGNNDSDSETVMEPWFCEPCSAGLNPRSNGNVYCELCPVQGGAYKRTDGGRWVHSLCAFYVPRVTFGDVDKLSRVSLRDVPHARYGAKSCVYCPNKLMARVGVSVKCDAGLCKSHAHVTCAHKRGLLVDAGASNSNQGHAPSGYGWGAHGDAMADPYYFCCPMHSDRSSVTLKKGRFAKVERQEKSFGARTLSVRESQKLQSKMAQFKEISAQQNKPSEILKNAEQDGENSEKRPCFLSSRWEFLSKIRQKTLLMDETLDEKSFAENFRVGLSLVSSAAGAAKYVLPPAFTVDFISYYHARETLLDELSSKVAKFPDTVVESKNEELQLNADIQKIQRQLEQLSKENRNKRDLLHNWYNILKQLDCKNMPQIFVPPGSSNVPTSSASKSPKKIVSSMPKLDHFSATTNNRPSLTKPVLVPSVPTTPQSPALPSPRLLSQHGIFECSTCKKKHDQHRLVFCETCKGRFHLQCLDPPLTKMPRLSTKYAWECSACFNKKQEIEAEAYDAMENGEKFAEEIETTDQKRQLRTVHKPVNRLLAENPKDEDRVTKKRMRQTSSKPKDVSPMKTLEPPLKRIKRVSTDHAAGSPKIALSKAAQNETENLSKQKDIAKPVAVSPTPFKVEQILNRYRQLTLAHRAKMAAAKQNSVASSQKRQNLSKSDQNSRKSSVDCPKKTTVSKNAAKFGKARRNSLPLPPVKTLLQQRKFVKSLEKAIPVAVVPLAQSPKVLEKREQAKANSPVKNDEKKIPIHEEKVAKEEKVDDAEDDEQMDELLSKILFTDDGMTNSSGQEGDGVEDREIDGFETLVPGRQRLYSTTDLSKAVSCVISNRLNAVQAALKYNVPRSTLLRYCRRAGFTGSGVIGGSRSSVSTPTSSPVVAAKGNGNPAAENEQEQTTVSQNSFDQNDVENASDDNSSNQYEVEKPPKENSSNQYEVEKPPKENSFNQNDVQKTLYENSSNQYEVEKPPKENSFNQNDVQKTLYENSTNQSGVQKTLNENSTDQNETPTTNPAAIVENKNLNVADLDAHNYSSPNRQDDDLLSQILRNKAASASKKNGNYVTDHHSSVSAGKNMAGNTNNGTSPPNSHRKLSYHSLPNPDDNVQIIRVEDL